MSNHCIDVTCPKCGTEYDARLWMGACPQCGKDYPFRRPMSNSQLQPPTSKLQPPT